MKKILHFIWGLPQNLIGLVMFLVLKWKAKKIWRFRDAYIVEMGGNRGAISLGMFVFTFVPNTTEWLVKHEYGHTIQSKMLGPIWLIVIGIPSIVWAGCFGWYRRKTKKSYYWFYTEKWANKLMDLK